MRDSRVRTGSCNKHSLLTPLKEELKYNRRVAWFSLTSGFLSLKRGRRSRPPSLAAGRRALSQRAQGMLQTSRHNEPFHSHAIFLTPDDEIPCSHNRCDASPRQRVRGEHEEPRPCGHPALLPPGTGLLLQNSLPQPRSENWSRVESYQMGHLRMSEELNRPRAGKQRQLLEVRMNQPRQ